MRLPSLQCETRACELGTQDGFPDCEARSHCPPARPPGCLEMSLFLRKNPGFMSSPTCQLGPSLFQSLLEASPVLLHPSGIHSEPSANSQAGVFLLQARLPRLAHDTPTTGFQTGSKLFNCSRVTDARLGVQRRETLKSRPQLCVFKKNKMK